MKEDVDIDDEHEDGQSVPRLQQRHEQRLLYRRGECRRVRREHARDPRRRARRPLYEEAEAAALDEQITITRYKTMAAESELYWDDEGTWKQWIPATAT